MIWNALDAEASLVEVDVLANDIEGVDRVIVRDNGHGMPAASCVRWTSVAESLVGGREKTVISADASAPTDFEIDGPRPTQEPVGTVFDSRLPAKNADRLNHESTVAGLTAE